jgi:hypothetical protein
MLERFSTLRIKVLLNSWRISKYYPFIGDAWPKSQTKEESSDRLTNNNPIDKCQPEINIGLLLLEIGNKLRLTPHPPALSVTRT